MTALGRCYNINDLRLVARKRLPKGIFELIDLGTEDGLAVAENRAAFNRLRLRTRFMVDLTERDWGINLFGKRSELPLGIAPTGVASLCWHQGELGLAKAAMNAGIPYTLAQGSGTSMEAIAATGGRLWFQVQMWEEVDLSYEMIARARDLDFEALVITIDGALGRIREHNERNGYSYPFKPNLRAVFDIALHPRYVINVLLRSLLTGGVPKNANYPDQYRRIVAWRDVPKPVSNEAMTWVDVAKLREFWPRTLIVKGVLGAGDARLAVEHGADGVVVSNHGGRAMDSSVSTIDALPEVVSEVGGRAAILLDSGIRRGSDVVKALAMGADMALVGRAGLYGVAAGGQAGAEKAIDILRTEFEKTMGYLGCRRVEELDSDIFAPVSFA